ncbi:MAG: ABC transporter ATP-binding protein [Granulosicoccus sp.]
MLELDSISKQVGAATHIRDVSLKLERGSLNVLLGPTLAGKTTLMRLMAGLDRPTAGDIRIDGQSVTGVSVRKRDVAMVYQQFINYPAFTVYENIASPLRIAGADKATIDRKVREAAELLQLTEFLQRTPLNLSGGQQQRTALARALVKGAELVLMDEPLANLDYKLREELRVELPRLFAETGAIFVYATTEPHEALLLGGRTATLHEGAVTQFGKTIEVYNQPRDLRTAQVFSDPPMNTLEVDGRSSGLQYGAHNLGQLPAVANGRYTVALRPHHVSLTPSSQHSVVMPAIVGASEITGSETYIHVSVGQSQWVVLTRGVHRFDFGDTIDLHLDPARYYLFDTDGKLCQAPVAQVEAA